jgi:hypothetical protein
VEVLPLPIPISNGVIGLKGNWELATLELATFPHWQQSMLRLESGADIFVHLHILICAGI